MKCPNSITGMVNALKQKHAPSNVIIKKEYEGFQHREGVRVVLSLWIEDTVAKTGLSWQDLKALVAKHLEDK